MRSLISSRRGHIPTILLFLEGLVLMTVVWFAFLSQEHNLDKLSMPLIKGSAEVSSLDKYVNSVAPILVDQAISDVVKSGNSDFESEFRKSFEKRAAAVDALESKNTNLFGLIRSQNYSLVKNSAGVYTLFIGGVFVKSEVEKNSFIRNFFVDVRFDSKKVLSA